MRQRQINGEALKAIREAKALYDPAFRAASFSITCLMSPGHLCNIEKLRKFPPEEVIHRIAAHLGVPVGAISHFVASERTAAA